MEYWVESRVCVRKCQAICWLAPALGEGERTEAAVIELVGGLAGLDVMMEKPYIVTYIVYWGWRVTIIVILGLLLLSISELHFEFLVDGLQLRGKRGSI